MKFLKILGKLLIGIFIALMIYFSVRIRLGSGRVVLALFCAIILGYLYYMYKYEY